MGSRTGDEVTHNARLSEPTRKASHIILLSKVRKGYTIAHRMLHSSCRKKSESETSGDMFLDMEPSRRPGGGKNLAMKFRKRSGISQIIRLEVEIWFVVEEIILMIFPMNSAHDSWSY